MDFVIPNFNMGGAQRVAVTLANGCHSLKPNLNVRIVCLTGSGDQALLQRMASCNLLVISKSKRGSFGLIKYFLIYQPSSYIFFSHPYLLVLSSAFLKIFWAKKRKLLAREINNLISRRARITGWMEILFLRRAYANAHAVFCPSRELARFWSERRVPAVFLPTPLHIADLPCVDQQQLQDPYILGVGRLTKQKRFDVLIQAFSTVSQHNSQLKLIIVGEGEAKRDLESMAERLGVGDRVVFVSGMMSPAPYYKAASCIVISSDYEGFPNVLLEALKFECPIIASNCDYGPREVLSDRALFEPGNYEELARLLIDVLHDRSPYIVTSSMYSLSQHSKTASVECFLSEVFDE